MVFHLSLIHIFQSRVSLRRDLGDRLGYIPLHIGQMETAQENDHPCNCLLYTSKRSFSILSHPVRFVKNFFQLFFAFVLIRFPLAITSQPAFRMASTAFKLLPPVEMRSSMTTTF